MATVNTSFTSGMEALRSQLLNGDGNINVTQSFIKALSGDLKLVCTPATVSKAATSSAWTQTVVVTLTTNNGEPCSWYNGNVTLSVADTSSAGTAAISPAAGARPMTDGSLTVTLSGDAAAWLAADTATLTVAPTANNPGVVAGSLIANATCVVTFTS